MPDGTDREHTGVSLRARAIALSMCRDGFDARHETPVVVRTSAAELFFASDAYGRWVRFCAENRAATPRPLRRKNADETRASLMSRALYTTLGSSHLNVALRLVETDTPVFGADVRLGEALGRTALRAAPSSSALRSVVLTPEAPRGAARAVAPC